MLSQDILKSPAILCLAALLVMGCGEDEVISPTPTGSIEASLAMTGGAPDADGIRVAVGIVAAQVLLDGESHVFSDLSTGTYTVTITDVAFNCVVKGETSRSVSVAPNDTTLVSFTLDCKEPASYDIAFVREVTRPDIWVMQADGSDLLNLTGSSNVREETITWSPDGARIAFSGLVNFSCGIYVMDSDGSNVEELYSQRCGSSPSWSPDGTRIAFSAAAPEGDQSDIYVMNANGSNVINLTRHPAGEAVPAWSPDGARIAFMRDWDIYVMDADGSNPVNLTNDPSPDSSPAWSPDGQLIAFMSFREGSNWEIFAMDADGSSPINLTNDPAFDATGSWSPDGSRIAFTSGRGGGTHIFTMDADGSNPVRLTDGVAFDKEPEWSPAQ